MKENIKKLHGWLRDKGLELSDEKSSIGYSQDIVKPEIPKSERYVDPAMIGVLVGMALMFIIICVVLRLFSNARWRENRTIFNTPNPRLMNVSLLRESKHERRGSRGSVRAPSRRPSMASLRPQSPQSAGPNQGGQQRGANVTSAEVSLFEP
ncbi:uncharacterized protein LOC113389317 [Ctenocephalides felis]|uniref:uncharacterized protein LOC113389317 n=1 Tax=Ctenocephalides felis TaxID=7515 RepID=UPI000E6E585A|nr:uncharacterized protein LOC113389317 [Ctenocephalides felis]